MSYFVSPLFQPFHSWYLPFAPSGLRRSRLDFLHSMVISLLHHELFFANILFFVYKKNRETLLFTICLSGSVSVFHEIFISWSVYTSWFGSTALWKFSMNLADTACIFSSCSKTLWPMVLLSNYSSTCCQHAGKRRFYVCRHRTYYSVYSEFKSQ